MYAILNIVRFLYSVIVPALFKVFGRVWRWNRSKKVRLAGVNSGNRNRWDFFQSLFARRCWKMGHIYYGLNERMWVEIYRWFYGIGGSWGMKKGDQYGSVILSWWCSGWPFLHYSNFLDICFGCTVDHQRTIKQVGVKDWKVRGAVKN